MWSGDSFDINCFAKYENFAKIVCWGKRAGGGELTHLCLLFCEIVYFVTRVFRKY